MSYILHIDTSGSTAITALSRQGRLSFFLKNKETRNHASNINGMIEGLLKKAGVSLSELDAISVVGGPGSYTGLRIGLATAKAFCYVLDKPLLMSNKLDLLALQHFNNFRSDKAVGAILPAREKEYFFVLYDKNGIQKESPKHVFQETLIETLHEFGNDLVLAGEINEEIRNIAAGTKIQFVEDKEIDLEFWALNTFSNYKTKSFENPATADPFYLKQAFTHK